MFHMRIHDFVVCEEQRGRPVSASDQHLCFLLYGKYSIGPVKEKELA